MNFVHTGYFLLTGLFLIGHAEAESSITGTYSCTVFEKAGIASTHLENSAPPEAFAEHDVRSTFAIEIQETESVALPYLVIETLDRGKNPDRTEYDSEFSLLHSPYHGDGANFTAKEDQGFLRLFFRLDGNLSFYHAGFEYPGGVDVRLSVRFGECSDIH